MALIPGGSSIIAGDTVYGEGIADQFRYQSGKARVFIPRGFIVLKPLLESFHSKQSEIRIAISRDQHDVVKTLDKELVIIFENMLKYDPRSQAELVTLCRFLLEQVQDYEERSPNKQRIIDRVIHLLETGIQPADDPHRTAM